MLSGMSNAEQYATLVDQLNRPIVRSVLDQITPLIRTPELHGQAPQFAADTATPQWRWERQSEQEPSYHNTLCVTLSRGALSICLEERAEAVFERRTLVISPDYEAFHTLPLLRAVVPSPLYGEMAVQQFSPHLLHTFGQLGIRPVLILHEGEHKTPPLAEAV